jgi:hypothetical protein
LVKTDAAGADNAVAAENKKVKSAIRLRHGIEPTGFNEVSGMRVHDPQIAPPDNPDLPLSCFTDPMGEGS